MLFFALTTANMSAQSIEVHSPDKRLSLKVNTVGQLSYSVELEGKKVMEMNQVEMKTEGGATFGALAKLKDHSISSKSFAYEPVVPNKDARINLEANSLKLVFEDESEMVFLLFDDGLAYRFEDNNNTAKKIANEHFSLSFPENSKSFFPQEESLYSHYERLYLHKPIEEFEEGDFCSLPVLFETPTAKVLLTESALHNYPNLFVEKGKENAFISKFPKYVLETKDDEKEPDRAQALTKKANYIAEIEGARAYPWRVFIISDDDRTFVESNIVTGLAEKSKIEDASWIKPGKVAWDWYNANNIYGVDFRAGLNQETYKYYIDFASENGIEYVILDEGWTKSTTEILEDSDEMDVPTLIEYAKSKNVGIILWVLWKPLVQDTDKILKLYSSWGAVGVKVDFMQRADQAMVKSYEDIAEVAAKYQLLVDYHGSFKPAGIERVFPNVVNYEGVRGNEWNKWSEDITPEHTVTLPFIRMAAGPMDFTPGSMMNRNKVNYINGEPNYAPYFTRPMSFGTRAHQVAMYVVYEAPLQMLCESPTIYKKEQETVDFITKIPTTWDETVVLEGKVSDYIVVARRKGENWYVGAMTDWTARDFELDFSFLGEGNYSMTSMKDGINADRNAMDYKIETQKVTQESKWKISLSSGGGWVAILNRD